MPCKVALLSSPEHCAYIKSISDTMELPYELSFEPYNRVAELPALFAAIQGRYDAFCTTGAFSRLVLMKSSPNPAKPIIAISESVAEFYRILLSLLYHDRGCDFSTIVFDHSLWLGRDDHVITALDYIDGTLEFEERARSEALASITEEKLLHAEDIIVRKAQELREQSKLSLLICRHSTGFLAAREAGIPCVFAYPSHPNVKANLLGAWTEIDRIQLEENMPAVICLTSPTLQQIGTEDITADSINLQKALLDFNQDQTAGMIIKKASGVFELYTTRRVVLRITDNATRCRLGAHLLGRLGQHVAIGYGLGNDVSQASRHAKEAMELSLEHEGSYLVDENGNLSGCLDRVEGQRTAREPDARVEEAAAKSGLSPLTVQRIISALDLLGSCEITTQELAEALQVTNANANRFIKQLNTAGLAVKVGEKRARLRGRPTRVYRIDL